MLASLLRVSARHRRHYQGVLSVSTIARPRIPDRLLKTTTHSSLAYTYNCLCAVLYFNTNTTLCQSVGFYSTYKALVRQHQVLYSSTLHYWPCHTLRSTCSLYNFRPPQDWTGIWTSKCFWMITNVQWRLQNLYLQSTRRSTEDLP